MSAQILTTLPIPTPATREINYSLWEHARTLYNGYTPTHVHITSVGTSRWCYSIEKHENKCCYVTRYNGRIVYVRPLKA